MSQDLGTSGDVADLRVWRWGSRDPQRVEMWGTSLTSASIWGHQGTSLTSMPGNRNPAIPMPKDLGSGDAVDLYGRRPEGVGTSVTSTPRDLGTSRGTLQPPPPPPPRSRFGAGAPPWLRDLGTLRNLADRPCVGYWGHHRFPFWGRRGHHETPPPSPVKDYGTPPHAWRHWGGPR